MKRLTSCDADKSPTGASACTYGFRYLQSLVQTGSLTTKMEEKYPNEVVDKAVVDVDTGPRAETVLPRILLICAALLVSERAKWNDKRSSVDGGFGLTSEMISTAATLGGIKITPEETTVLLAHLSTLLSTLQRPSGDLRKLRLPNDVPPAFVFDPVPAVQRSTQVTPHFELSSMPDVCNLSFAVGDNCETVAFASLRELSELLKARKITSVDLTKMYLTRLKRYDPELHFVSTLTEERALFQAAEADREISAGRYRGPLHGIPWGAKDLFCVRGYKNFCGERSGKICQDNATVVERLDRAGAVLIAKLTMGAAFAGGDGSQNKTRNPWNTRQTSSGSSAGSASAVAAGCVAFALGTETMGSISLPSARCGCTGFRPTFGTVPRTGVMNVAWTLDKIGPLCRSAEDGAIVLAAICGEDGRDFSVKGVNFTWQAGLNWSNLRVGYVEKEFEIPPLRAEAEERERQLIDRSKYDLAYATRALTKIQQMGVKIVPISMPELPFEAIASLLEAEIAAQLEECPRSTVLPLDSRAVPDQFRLARFHSATDYIQAMRARTVAIAEMGRLFEQVDLIVTPSSRSQLVATNVTGHPAIIVPNGLRGLDAPKAIDEGDGADRNEGGPGTPVSLTFLGAHYEDAQLAAFAKAYQDATGFHRVRPAQFDVPF